MSTVQQPREVSVHNPLPGRIKFFNQERGFGFIETSEGDLFFGLKGYRRIKGLGNGRAEVLYYQELPSFEVGQLVQVIDLQHGNKGAKAIEWTIPSYNTELVCLWVVIQRVEQHTEREATSNPVCDNTLRAYKTVTTRTIDTFINEKIIAVRASKEEAEAYTEDRQRPYGVRSGTGSKVTFRVEQININ